MAQRYQQSVHRDELLKPVDPGSGARSGTAGGCLEPPAAFEPPAASTLLAPHGPRGWPERGGGVGGGGLRSAPVAEEEAPRVDPAANGVQRRRDGAGAGSPAGRRSTAAPRPASDSDSKAESAASARPQRPARDGVSSGPGPSVKNLPFDPRWTASPFAPR